MTYGAWAAYAAVFGFQGASLSDLTPSDGPKNLAAYIDLLQKDWYRAIRVNWVDQLWGDFSWVDTPFPTWVQTTLLVLSLGPPWRRVAWYVQVARPPPSRAGPRKLGPDVIESGGRRPSSGAPIVVTFVFFVGLGYLNFRRRAATT